MKRMKHLGVAVFAALALTAGIGAAGASAANFEAESYPATFAASETGELQFTFSSFNTQCQAPALSGSLGSVNPLAEPTAADSTCAFLGTVPMKMNGCKIGYRPGIETAVGKFEGAFDVNCPAGKRIEITSANCSAAIPAQVGLRAQYENVGAGTQRAVKVTAEANNLKYTQLKGAICSEKSAEAGLWGGSWNIQGRTGGGKQQGLWLKSGNVALPAKGLAVEKEVGLKTGAETSSIFGQQNPEEKLVLKTAAGTLTCSTANFTATTFSAWSIQLQPSYSGCTNSGLATTINPNGCTFNVAVGIPTGHADISCPAGKSITAVVAPGGVVSCTITIGTQETDSGGLTFQNQVITAKLSLGLAITGIDYHQQTGSGLARCTTQDGTTGTYTGSSTLAGA